MDELQMISTMLAKPDPSEDVVERGRLALRAGRSGGPMRRRPVGWITGGLSLTAAAAAAAVLVVSQTNAPTPTTNSPPVRAGQRPVGTQALSGQQVLLAAATTAAAQADEDGTYWYVRNKFVGVDPRNSSTQEQWTRRDGVTWYRGADGKLVGQTRFPSGFTLAYTSLTLAQLRALPTDPAALTEWIKHSFTHPPQARPARGGKVTADGRNSHGQPVARIDPLPARYLQSETALQLANLLFRVPAPPAVRSAAFRALAAMPVVRNLGSAAGGGRHLRIALPVDADKYRGNLPAGVEHFDLVVNPATGKILSETNYQGRDEIRAANWTDHLPR
jgi:hypothetical protein